MRAATKKYTRFILITLLSLCSIYVNTLFLLFILRELILFLLIIILSSSATVDKRIFKIKMILYIIFTLGGLFILFIIIFNQFSFIRIISLDMIISIKIGLFPFTYYLLYIVKYISLTDLFFFLVISKIPTLTIFEKLSSVSLVYFNTTFLIFLCLVRVFYIYKNAFVSEKAELHYKNIIFMYLIVRTNLYFITCELHLLWFYFILSNLFLMVFLLLLNYNKVLSINSLILLLGVPPSPLFLFKLYLFFRIDNQPLKLLLIVLIIFYPLIIYNNVKILMNKS